MEIFNLLCLHLVSLAKKFEIQMNKSTSSTFITLLHFSLTADDVFQMFQRINCCVCCAPLIKHWVLDNDS